VTRVHGTGGSTLRTNFCKDTTVRGRFSSENLAGRGGRRWPRRNRASRTLLRRPAAHRRPTVGRANSALPGTAQPWARCMAVLLVPAKVRACHAPWLGQRALIPAWRPLTFWSPVSPSPRIRRQFADRRRKVCCARLAACGPVLLRFVGAPWPDAPRLPPSPVEKAETTKKPRGRAAQRLKVSRGNRLPPARSSTLICPY
jgi:hypothetical protein